MLTLVSAEWKFTTVADCIQALTNQVIIASKVIINCRLQMESKTPPKAT